MSKPIAVEDLHPRDMFEMPHGSVYMAVGGREAEDGPLRMRLWCAHDPDPITFEPPLIVVPAGQKVGLLSRDEADGHYRHPGYVEHVFVREMDRRHAATLQVLEAKRQQEAVEQRQRDRATRPWWKKLFA